MIDHLIRFDSEADAIADPVVGAYWSEEGGWRGDCCFPGQKVWRPEDDTVAIDPESGAEYAITHPLPYWYVTVSLSQVSTDLRNHASCMIVWDTDVDVSVYTAIPPESLLDYRLSPLPADRRYLNGSV